MTSTCPACNKSVDPLRSRFVRVLGGKVVAYCSAECAREPGASPAEGTGRTASPATGVPTAIPTPPRGLAPRATPAAGVPARATPAAGVPARRTPPAGVPVRPATPAHGTTIPIDSGPVIEIIHDSSSGATAEPAERSERAKHPDEIPMSEFWSADKDKPPARPASEPSSGAIKATAGRDDTLDKWAADTTDHGGRRAASELDTEHDLRPRSRATLVILILLLLAAGGLLLYQYVVKNGLAAATHAKSAAPLMAESAAAIAPPAAPREPPAPPAAAAPPPIDVTEAVAQARATLTTTLTATSPRLARIAAAALARTEDPTALAVLAAHLGIDDHAPPPADLAALGDIARLDIAYSLARGHDRRGSDILAAALRSQRAEVRDEAARLLALLGDPRGVPHLLDLLDISQRRLGAAEHLVHLVEPHAIKVLEQLRAAAKVSQDDKARATIALGVAGRAAVAPELRNMLGDPHFNAFAAAALAELKDAAARPVLEHQLESPSLRVRAARALRRLDPTLDARPVLPRLLEILKTGRDRDQVQAAEAILLLAGPPSWSTYD